MKQVTKDISVVNKAEKEFREGNISLILASYEDIFSSFDPRSYSNRALSDDFLAEAKRASRDKAEGIELNLLIPRDKRNSRDEAIIKKRMKDHFVKHFFMLETEIKRVFKMGVLFVLAGIILMFIASFVLFSYPEGGLGVSFLIVFLEPAGWFFFWEGLDLLIFDSKKKRPEYHFYKKMSSCLVVFDSY